MKNWKVNKKMGIALSLVIGAGIYGASTLTYASSYGQDAQPALIVVDGILTNGTIGRSGLGAASGLGPEHTVDGTNGGKSLISAVYSNNLSNTNILWNGNVGAIGGVADYVPELADGKDGIDNATGIYLNGGAAAIGGNGGNAIIRFVNISGNGNHIIANEDRVILASGAAGAQGGAGGSGGVGMAGGSAHTGHAQDGAPGANGIGDGTNGGDGVVGTNGIAGNNGVDGGLSSDGAKGGNGGSTTVEGFKIGDSLGTSIQLKGLNIIAIGGNGGAGGAGGNGGNGSKGGIGQNGGAGGNAGNGAASTSLNSNGGQAGNAAVGGNGGQGGNGGNGSNGGQGGNGGHGGNVAVVGMSADNSTVDIQLGDLAITAKGGDGGEAGAGGEGGNGGQGGQGGNGGNGGQGGVGGAGTGLGSHGSNSANAIGGEGGNGGQGGVGGNGGNAGLQTGNGGNTDIVGFTADNSSNVVLDINATDAISLRAKGGDAGSYGHGGAVGIGGQGGVGGKGSMGAPDGGNGANGANGTMVGKDTPVEGAGLAGTVSNQFASLNDNSTMFITANQDIIVEAIGGTGKTVGDVTAEFARAEGNSSFSYNGKVINVEATGSIDGYITQQEFDAKTQATGVYADKSLVVLDIDRLHVAAAAAANGQADANGLHYTGDTTSIVNVSDYISTLAVGGLNPTGNPVTDDNAGDANAHAVSVDNSNYVGESVYGVHIKANEIISTAISGVDTNGTAHATAVSAYGKGYIDIEADSIVANAYVGRNGIGSAIVKTVYIDGMSDTGENTDTVAFIKTDSIVANFKADDIQATALGVKDATLVLSAKTEDESIFIGAGTNDYTVMSKDSKVKALAVDNANIIATDNVNFAGEVNINNSTIVFDEGARIDYSNTTVNGDPISAGDLNLNNSKILTNDDIIIEGTADISDSTIKMYTDSKQVGSQMLVDYENIYQHKQDFNEFGIYSYDGTDIKISGTNEIYLRSNLQNVDIGYGRAQTNLKIDGQTYYGPSDTIYLDEGFVTEANGEKPVINVNVFDQGMRNGFMTDKKEIVFEQGRSIISTYGANFAKDVEVFTEDQKYDNGTFSYNYGANGEFSEDGTSFIFTGVTVKDMQLSNIPKAAHQSRSAMLSIMNAENDALSQRLGELRGQQAENGVWARYIGGKESTNSKFGDVKTTYNGVQIGYDRAIGSSKEWNAGLAFSYIDGKADVYTGNSELSSKTIGVYTTYANAKGHFFDAIVKTGRISNKYQTIGGTIAQATGTDYSSKMLMGSLEYGYKHKLSEQWYIEPSVQFSMGNLGSHEYSIATQDGLTNIKADSINSTLLRAGVKLGTNNTKGANFYVKLGVAHEFQGNIKTGIFADGKYVGIEDKLKGTSLEYGLGINGKLGKASNYYLDLASTTGGKIKKELAISAGLRFGF